MDKPMQIINKHYERRVALGVFDGVHLGHQRLIADATLVMTFNPHPQMITNPYKDEIKLLTTLDEKQSLLPNLIVLQFNQAIANLSSEDFVRQILVEELSVDTVITGYDYYFGKGRSGDTETLRLLGKQYGFELKVIDRIDVEGVAVKSSFIRDLIVAGDVAKAAKFLGRDYFLFGQVIHGKGLGRTLGFPTVNIIVPPEKLVPKIGVYGGRIMVEDKLYACAINIGLISRELSANDPANIIIEAHILDFDVDVYGKKVVLSFSFLHRDLEQFANLDLLTEQIRRDVSAIRLRLGPVAVK